MRVIFGLGSNLGDIKKNLWLATDIIKTELLTSVKESKIYNFPALVPSDAPPEWNINYGNMAISGELIADFPAGLVLEVIKEIEFRMGRKASARWSPRIIDIDILAWGDQIINTPELIIPHQSLTEREFVLVPMNEIAPDWVHPITGKTVRQHLAEL